MLYNTIRMILLCQSRTVDTLSYTYKAEHIMANELIFRVKKHVTVPQLKLVTGTPVYVKVLGEIFKAKELTGEAGRKQKDESGNPVAPPDLMRVLNLEDGVECEMIVNTVLGTELKDTYPSNGYIGLCFEFQRNARGQGKRYDTFAIAEIEIEEPAAASATPVAATKESEKPSAKK